MSKVLILEDDEMTMMLYKEILGEENHEVISAADGKEVLENLDQKPDLILMDMNFPGMSCKELVTHIQNEESSKDIPFIVVSGDDNIQQFAKDLGAKTYLRKPFSLDDFLSVIKSHL